MKQFIFGLVLGVCCLQAGAQVSVDGKVPSGNVIVEGIDGDTVRLRQDMRDSNDWFYWAFRVTGAEGRTMRFLFTSPYAGGPVSCRGPVVTKDGGKTWSYPCDGKSKENEFTYSFAAGEKEVWFYQTFQYYPWQWDEFLKRHEADRGRVFEAGVLCKSRKGRDVPKAVFGRIDGKARYRVWLSSRTHCGEAPATYVLEGWLERVFGKDALGAWLRENVEFMVVPFVDYDGVVDGDQGKGRRPHDHNRDYVEFLYPESKAIAAWITERAQCRIDVAFDHHSPWVRNRYNEKIYQTYHGDEWNTDAKRKWGRFVMAHQDGSLGYSTADDFPWGFGWNCPKNTANPKAGAKPLKGLGGWIAGNVPNLLINSTYEVPFANAKGNVVTPEKCRAFGNASAAALRDFLETMRPEARENVIYSEASAGSGCFPIATSPKERNWKFSFLYRFDDDGRPHEFTLKLLFGDRGTPDVRELTVAEGGSFFGCARPAAPRDGMEGFLQNRQYNKGAIVVTDGTAAFWTYRGGKLVKECETAFPAKPLVGWKLAARNERQDGQLRLDRAVVTDGTARPYDRGDPTEWLAEPPLATADQWDEFWGRPVTDREPMAVDFAKQSFKMYFRSEFGGEKPGACGNGAAIFFNAATGRVARISFTPVAEEVTLSGRRFGNGCFTNVTEKVVIPSNGLAIGGDKAVMERTVLYTRPSLCASCRYQPREINEIYASYDRLERLADRTLVLEAVKIRENRYRIFLCHNVLCELETPSPVVSIGFAGQGAEARGWTPDAPKEPDPQVYRLPVQAGGFRLERCNDLSRDAFDAMPSSCLFNVPKRNWIRAKAKCRIDPTAPLSAVPVVTARLTQFYANDGRSLAACEKTVDLRDANAAVVRKGDDYEVSFDFDSGELQGLVAMTDGMARRELPYLHFGFAGPTRGASSLIVYSGSLEASPADLTRTYDLVVYGSSPAAISAAVQAKRMGISCVVVSPERRIGGLTTGGLGQTDIGNKSAFGGIALEFYRDVAKWYRDASHWVHQKRSDYLPDGQCAGTKGDDSMWTFEPSAALKVLEGWERRDGLEIRRGERLDRTAGKVRVEEAEAGGPERQRRIVSFLTEDGTEYRGKMFVDATYEGDLMAAAGVSYTVGRESNSVYGETISGNAPDAAGAWNHNLNDGISAYVKPGDRSSGLLPGVEPYDPKERPGDGDRRVQAYCFRMCLTDKPENRIPFAKPENYDERNYELLFRDYEAAWARPDKRPSGARVWPGSPIPSIMSKMPNRKTDSNNRCGFSTDFIGRNWNWPEGSYEEREKILKAHLDYQRGLMWTLANHPRIPEKVREYFSKYGTCKDEFADGLGDGWQRQLYVREARRLIGEYVMTEADCRRKRVAGRPVAMGAYTMDSHHVRRVETAEGFVRNEGNVEDGRMPGPYGIDYGAIVPKRAECANLFVPVCLSASHMAFGSIRMEPVFFALGQVAGTAAAQAVAAGCAVQDVPYPELRTRLLSDGQVIGVSK